MKPLMKALVSSMMLTIAPVVAHQAFAKANRPLNDQQTMKCIYGEKQSQIAFQDLQAAYGLRLIEAKDLFRTMDKAKSCADLKKNLQKMRTEMIAKFPTSPNPMTASAGSSSTASSGGFGSPASLPSTPSFGNGTTSSTFGTSSSNNSGPGTYGSPNGNGYGNGNGNNYGSTGSMGSPYAPPPDFYAPPAESYGFPDEDLDF